MPGIPPNGRLHILFHAQKSKKWEAKRLFNAPKGPKGPLGLERSDFFKGPKGPMGHLGPERSDFFKGPKSPKGPLGPWLKVAEKQFETHFAAWLLFNANFAPSLGNRVVEPQGP